MSSVISGEACALSSCYTPLLKMESPAADKVWLILLLAFLSSGKAEPSNQDLAILLNPLLPSAC